MLNIFGNCSSITSLIIGSGLKYIGIYAFANCSELTDVYCYTENVPSTKSSTFNNSYIEYATLYVPDGSLQEYKNTEPWSLFGTIKTLSGDMPETLKCATPTISYGSKKLMFDCETEGVEFVTEIKVADAGTFYDDRITLSATYEISVYATKAGYENSDVATATLVWANATFTDTTPEPTAISPAAEMAAVPVLIQSNGGIVTIQGAADGTPVSIYTTAGTQAGSAVSQNGRAAINTSLQAGSIAIIKIGTQSYKVAIK